MNSLSAFFTQPINSFSGNIEMSVQTLYTAATGMQSLETKLDVIANNLANVNTTGFKRGRANFEDLFYRHEVLPGSDDGSGNLTATGTSVGMGSRVSSIQTEHRQGAHQPTGSPLDIAIEGSGMLPVVDAASGETLYTRAGNMSLNAKGELVIGSASTGRVVQGLSAIPQESVGSVVIGADGNVQYQVVGNPTLSSAGFIQLALFQNPEGLLKLGENLFRETAASGTATLTTAGTQGAGTIQQNALEASNVEPVAELIDLIITQRSFELNSQTVKAGDEILQLIANLRRF